MAGGLGAIGKRELPETERRIAAGEIDNVGTAVPVRRVVI
jgi:hypothetical protein